MIGPARGIYLQSLLYLCVSLTIADSTYSLTVDTACSSSMYALHLAVNAIRASDCDSAIVASANWIADPGVQIALDKLGALSASSRCHTFDARAEGRTKHTLV